jgi:nucleotide-binding universal stress UspA family protein
MINLKRILLPTDFSPHNRGAVAYAQALTAEFEAELHLLHVVQDRAQGLPDFVMGLDLEPLREHLGERLEDHEHGALAQLEQVIDGHWRAAHHTILATRNGRPYPEIIRYVRAHDIDLVVLGTHGRGGLVHALLGSVAENVIRTAPCPVLAVRADGHSFAMP